MQPYLVDSAKPVDNGLLGGLLTEGPAFFPDFPGPVIERALGVHCIKGKPGHKHDPLEPRRIQLIGGGLATIGVAGSGVGIGIIFGNYVSAAGRNPAAAPKLFGNVLLGFALTEAIALFALVMAFIILFGS